MSHDVLWEKRSSKRWKNTNRHQFLIYENHAMKAIKQRSGINEVTIFSLALEIGMSLTVEALLDISSITEPQMA